MFGVPVALITMALPVVAAVVLRVGNSQRVRVLSALAKLPFPIEHEPVSANHTDSLHRYVIDSVTVRLTNELDRPALERIACDADTITAGRVLVIGNDTIAITSLSWRGDDFLLLEHLLSTWARSLHAEHAIAVVNVTWSLSGPPSSL